MFKEVFLFFLSGTVFPSASFGLSGVVVITTPVLIFSSILFADFIDSNKVDVVSLCF